ncbi:protein STRUBBELIG-RECEPTOR FAMILY 3-like isoform X1 [Zingiber officinale]|uniref:protein STRUBBELIG-RECEPTOR FAMILY 3-like isoform X1 n=1 Tax=Zingiber officinale TaxID=94328 RepID=UPI001C4AEDC3|nr:protein STRUBBELIG-RECEPTOR FAMILY 3-like isoform X1 [Zingiber officinale]XP_042449284.1 protein STRUBBELIG-RECEPTOR FAMILY 3-like isoform X1 [Zingiber officinale]XP_042449285.1 protein STRUBBELIG-RECEPTOR FAMILY 3-like isoform X1 [Zingiber officinale]
MVIFAQVNDMNSKVILWVCLVVIFVLSHCYSFTDERDVAAINGFYVALGSPPLPGWVPNGGDPCTENWQGVQCVISNITAIVINAANLGGQLGDALGNFSSIITIDLSNNNIGGGIPGNLPLTLRAFFLSANQFTGSIPDSLSKLTLLTDMSINNNKLSGDLPDAFSSLTGLINLDLSFNNFSGPLPASMGNLSSLTTFHMQSNQLSGLLNVLEDLPLKDLNIENNLFSGPIPEKLLDIPNFKKDGNPFNTSIAPSVAPPQSASPQSAPPQSASPPHHSGSRIPDTKQTNSSNEASSQENSGSGNNGKMSTLKVVAYVVVSVIITVVIILLIIFCISKHQVRKSNHDKLVKSQAGITGRRFNEPINEEHSAKTNNIVGQFAKGDHNDEEKENKHKIDMRETDLIILPPPPPPLLTPPPPPQLRHVEKLVAKPIAPGRHVSTSQINIPATSATSFSVAELQQYTNYFNEENLVRDGMLGKVYLAELSDGKLLEVLKLDNWNSRIPVDDFLELVLSISDLRHANIAELVGYCAEFDQRLLVYKHFSKKTLDYVIHVGDDLNGKLSWGARIEVALGVARALEYLHRGCQPPLVHQNFEPANILINDKLVVRVTECGLSSLMSSNSVIQLSGRMRTSYSYEAPEVNDGGEYTDRSDVYSFGVIMLELLTGHKPYDSTRPRAEQHLVRWASSQLYDINDLKRMVDPSLAGRYSEKSLSCFADIISSCIQQAPEFRPAISEVVQDLIRMVKDLKAARN